MRLRWFSSMVQFLITAPQTHRGKAANEGTATVTQSEGQVDAPAPS